eukprot:701176-Heterocapsa_arctica.AAC.1
MLPRMFLQDSPSACFGPAIFGDSRNGDRFKICHAFCKNWTLHAHNTFHVPLFVDLVTYREVNRLRMHESQRDSILSDFAPAQVKSWAARDAG